MSKYIPVFLMMVILVACSSENKKVQEQTAGNPEGIPVIIDTDANNELDDQHALAYLFFNKETFNVVGVTVNATRGGGPVEEHRKEAERIMKLCNVDQVIPLKTGANGNYDEIINQLRGGDFDGKEAVNFIIMEARRPRTQKLVLLPVGKLTNIALALKLAPDIKDDIRIVWLGSNFPEKGEYNLENDISSMNYVLQQDVPFEMVTVRYGGSNGSDVVRVTPGGIEDEMEGEGPAIEGSITGRHGQEFSRFGDYSVDLFSHIDLHGDPPSRALYDMVAVAIVKNSQWGEQKEFRISNYTEENGWETPSDTARKMIVWENFNKDSILEDFFRVVKESE